MPDSIFKLNCFCNGITNGLIHFADKGFFDKLVELVSDCDSEGLGFYMRGTANSGLETKIFKDVDAVVAYMFEKVELHNHHIVGICLHETHCSLNGKRSTTYDLNLLLA